MKPSALSRFIAQVISKYPWTIRIPYIVYRFFQPKYSMGVVGIVWNAQQEVLLVEHVFHPRHPWGLPGGWIGNNEKPTTALLRELEEELGLQATIGTLVLCDKTQYNHLDFAYTCTVQNDINKLSNELLAYRWFPISQLPQLHAFQYQAIMNAQSLQE